MALKSTPRAGCVREGNSRSASPAGRARYLRACIAVLVGAAFLVPVALSPASAAVPKSRAGRQVAAAPVQAAAASLAGCTAYVADEADPRQRPVDFVFPINLGASTVGTGIPVGDGPLGVAVTPDRNTLLVAVHNSNKLLPVDLRTSPATPGTPITVGLDPVGVAVSPNGTRAVVTNFVGDSATVLNLTTATPTVIGTVLLGPASRPVGVTISPDSKTAYVADSGKNTVTPINLTTSPASAGTPIPVGTQPQYIAITPDGKTAYVTNDGSASVTPINLTTSPATALSPIAVGSNPIGIAIAPNGKTAYVVNNGSKSVTPIDLATNTALTAITGVGVNPKGIAITPDGTRAYVVDDDFANGGKVFPIDLTTRTLLPAITGVGVSPTDIAITCPPMNVPITTQVVPAAITLGASFQDRATLTPSPIAAAPTGTVTFKGYAPADTACTGTPVFTSTNALNAAGTSALSSKFTPSTVGTYRMIAAYSGDRNYNAVAGLCAATGESVVVTGGPTATATSTSLPPTPPIPSGPPETGAGGTAGLPNAALIALGLAMLLSGAGAASLAVRRRRSAHAG